MATPPAEQVGNDSVRRRRRFDEYLVAIYKTAFGRPLQHDIFSDAIVRWTDFIPPTLLFIVVQTVFAIAKDAQVRHVIGINGRAAAIVLAILAGAAALRFIVAGAVTWCLGRIFAAPDRLLPGLLGYLWTIAALVSPGIMIIRLGMTPHESRWMLIMQIVAMLAVGIFFPARIMKLAFGLPAMGKALLVALAGTIAAAVVDFVVGGLLV